MSTTPRLRKTPRTRSRAGTGYDPVALAKSSPSREKGAKLMGEFAKRQSASGKTLLADELGIGKAFLELASR